MARACVIVLDAVGAGELPDAAEFGDEGSNTLANVARADGPAIITFDKAETGKPMASYTDRGVVFALSHPPTKSHATGRVIFFPHLKTPRKGILNAMANESIPVEVRFPKPAASATLVLWGSIGLAFVGILLVVYADVAWLVVLGIVLWGLGAALGFPIGMSAAADDPARAAARVSVVSLIGYCAFLTGPPLIGFIGHQVGTLPALVTLLFVLVPAAVCVPAARKQRATPGR